MRRIRSGGLLCMMALLGGAHAEIVDAVLATIETEVILQSDIMAQIAPLLTNLRATSTDQETYSREANRALREALDQAIDQKILYREGVLLGFEVPEEALEDRINRIREQYDSNEAFMKLLTEAGETMSDFREQTRKKIMAISVGMRRRQALEKEAVISESDMRAYYQEHLPEFTRPQRVRVSRIFLDADASPEARASVKARMESLKKELSLGADFADLARTYSQGPEASEGGTVGWVLRGDLVENLERAAFSLPVGSVSEVLETQFGFMLLKVEAKEEGGAASIDEMRTEIEPKLRAEYAEERYRKWLEELRRRGGVRIFL